MAACKQATSCLCSAWLPRMLVDASPPQSHLHQHMLATVAAVAAAAVAIIARAATAAAAAFSARRAGARLHGVSVLRKARDEVCEWNGEWLRPSVRGRRRTYVLLSGCLVAWAAAAPAPAQAQDAAARSKLVAPGRLGRPAAAHGRPKSRHRDERWRRRMPGHMCAQPRHVVLQY